MDCGHGTLEGDTSQADEVDNFKPAYKKYKRRDQPVDLKDVIDLREMTELSSSSVKRLKPVIPSETPIAGLKPAQDWSIFHFVNHAGFYVIQNPFLAGSQRYWTSRCLQDFPHPPHHTNLIVHPDLDPGTIWDSFLEDFRQRGSAANSSSSPIRKLRWTTVGYHYQWSSKVYKEEDHTPFPQDVALLAHYVACVLGFPQFQAESGIINYYYPDSTLGPHTDHSELDHDAPLISFSFGQDAVFLMGGLSKAQTPTALWLHSGDICVMSGEARLAYHSVPRIVPSSSGIPPPCFDLTLDDWKMVNSWAGSVKDAPDCGGDQRQLPPAQDTHVMSDCSAVFPSHMMNSPENKDFHISATDNSCHVCSSTQGTLEKSNSDSTAENSTLASMPHRESSSQKSDFHASERNFAQQTNSPPDERNSHLALDSSVNVLTPTNGGQKQGDGQSVSHEDRVKEVNQQLARTLLKQDWAPFAAYLSSSRLNINIRQVLKAGQSFPAPGQC